VLTERRSRYSGSIKEERFCNNLDEFTQGEAPIPRFLLVIEPGVVPSFLKGDVPFPRIPTRFNKWTIQLDFHGRSS
jgi:hypothetical protein